MGWCMKAGGQALLRGVTPPIREMRKCKCKCKCKDTDIEWLTDWVSRPQNGGRLN